MKCVSFACLVLGAMLFTASAQQLAPLEQVPMESFKGMREVERYQLKIAEKHYLQKEYKIAMDEYEKFLSLYESSSGAPYAQLMWSQCLVKLRKVNTAIREGFQTVVDYWPDSPEARSAAFLIARSYQDMGEIEKARAAYQAVMEKEPEGNLAVLSRASLLEMAQTAGDEEATLKLLEELTFRTKRTDVSRDSCVNASRDLARYYFRRGAFEEGLRALETSYQAGQLDYFLYEMGSEGLRHLNSKDETKPQAVALAKKLAARFEASIPADLADDAAKNRAREALSRVAGVYSSVGDSEAVLKTHERSGKLLGMSDGLLGQIASHYRSMNQRDKARETYLRYENQAEGKSQIAYMFREERKYDEAIGLYRELIQQNPAGANNYLWAIAECYEGKGDWKNAIQTYRQTDNFPSNYLRMAICQRNLKQWNEALTLYSQVKASEQHAPEATLQMAHTYEDAGQRENAVKAFQLTCRSYPQSPQAGRAHAHLQTKYNITTTFGGGTEN